VTPAGLRPTSMTPRRQQLEQPNRRRSTYQTSKAVQTNRATSDQRFHERAGMVDMLDAENQVGSVEVVKGALTCCAHLPAGGYLAADDAFGVIDRARRI
ncbi:hypothetical protein, partial [Sphingobium salicis]|uniref:hypothetical protein n=1 Tax=Sphingobium sp. 11R-BB TaxID=3111639 RepID=UPI003C2A4214